MGESTYSEVKFSVRGRVRRALPYLLFTTIIVAAALIITRPWQETLPAGPGAMGGIAQVSHAGGEDIDTLAHPRHLAPNFRLESLTGELIEMADLRGTPVFLNFWATWCFPCITEMPAMQRVADAFGDEVAVVGINAGEDPDDARGFAESNGIDYLLLLDPGQDVTREYLVRAMPTSLFIGSDGVVESVRYGPITEEAMLDLIAPLLGSAGDSA